MLNIFTIQCTIERPYKFIEGDGVIVDNAILVAYARDEERVRQLVSSWESGGVKISIKSIVEDGTTDESEVLMKVYANTSETRLVED